MMKALIALLLASAATFPMLSFAQSSAPLTRAEVYGQVVQAERNGTLHTSKVHYPNDVTAQTDPAQHDYGASPDGNAQSGWVTKPSRDALGQSLYSHH